MSTVLFCSTRNVPGWEDSVTGPLAEALRSRGLSVAHLQLPADAAEAGEGRRRGSLRAEAETRAAAFLVLDDPALEPAAEEAGMPFVTLCHGWHVPTSGMPRAGPRKAGEAERIVCTLPEFDPCSAKRPEPVPGPLAALPQPADMPTEPFAVCVFSDEAPMVHAVLLELVEQGIGTALFGRIGETGFGRQLAREAIGIYREGAPSADDIIRSVLVIHDGNIHAAQMALHAGRPQLVLPFDDLGAFHFRVLSERKLAAGLGGRPEPGSTAATVSALVSPGLHRDRAMAWAQCIAGDTDAGMCGVLADRICRHVR